MLQLFTEKCPQCQTPLYKSFESPRCKECGRDFVFGAQGVTFTKDQQSGVLRRSSAQIVKMTDAGFLESLERASNRGADFFTLAQLQGESSLWSARQFKTITVVLALIFAVCLILPAVFLLFLFFSMSSKALQVAAGTFFFMVMVSLFLIIPAVWLDYLRKRGTLSRKRTQELVETWQRSHPVEKLLTTPSVEAGHAPDGRELERPPEPSQVERILIIEHPMLVDAFTLNGWGVENQALIVSAERYPEATARRVDELLASKPEIEVLLLHDATDAGREMLKQIKAQKTFALELHEVRDMGLKDVGVAQLLVLRMHEEEGGASVELIPYRPLADGLRLAYQKGLFLGQAIKQVMKSRKS